MRQDPWVVRLYGALVGLGPAGFRELAGDDAAETFAAMWRARSGRRRVTLVAVAFPRLVGVLAAEWWDVFFRRSVGGPGHRERGGGEEMGDWIRSVRHALRSLGRAPAIPAGLLVASGLPAAPDIGGVPV